MPSYLKALATIGVWGLFIFAWIIGISLFIQGIITGDLYGPQAPPMEIWAGSAVALGFAVGAGFLMLVRKWLE
jgi:hypothetical protein